MNGAKKRTLGAVTVGVFVAIAMAAPASAVQLLEFTIETRDDHAQPKEVYQVGEHVWVVCRVRNAGDEAFPPPWGVGNDHFAGTALWVFENAAGLGRDDLLAEEQPILTQPAYVYHDSAFFPGQTFTQPIFDSSLHDNLGNLVGLGEYTLLAVDGPDTWVWGGATVDYSNAYANITIAPEPGTICLLAGMAAVGLFRRGKALWPGRRSSGESR